MIEHQNRYSGYRTHTLTPNEPGGQSVAYAIEARAHSPKDSRRLGLLKVELELGLLFQIETVH